MFHDIYSFFRITEAKTDKDDGDGTNEENPDDEDPPVQGPLPYEPDDAPWKKTNETSGVRKLYVKPLQISHQFFFFENYILNEFCFFLSLVSVFVNYLPIKVQQVFRVVRYQHSLKWLYLLVIIVVLFKSNNRRQQSNYWAVEYALMQYLKLTS